MNMCILSYCFRHLETEARRKQRVCLVCILGHSRYMRVPLENFPWRLSIVVSLASLQISRDTQWSSNPVVPMGNTTHWFCSCHESSGFWTGISRLVRPKWKLTQGPELYCQTEDGTGKDLVHWCQLASLGQLLRCRKEQVRGWNAGEGAVSTLISWGKRDIHSQHLYRWQTPSTLL